MHTMIFLKEIGARRPPTKLAREPFCVCNQDFLIQANLTIYSLFLFSINCETLKKLSLRHSHILKALKWNKPEFSVINY